MTTQSTPTPTPNTRRYSKEALARLVDETLWPTHEVFKRLDMLELDVQIERLQAELNANNAITKTLTEQIAALKGAEQLKKIAEYLETAKKWEAIWTRLEALRKRRFPA